MCVTWSDLHAAHCPSNTIEREDVVALVLNLLMEKKAVVRQYMFPSNLVYIIWHYPSRMCLPSKIPQKLWPFIWGFTLFVTQQSSWKGKCKSWHVKLGRSSVSFLISIQGACACLRNRLCKLLVQFLIIPFYLFNPQVPSGRRILFCCFVFKTTGWNLSIY